MEVDTDSDSDTYPLSDIIVTSDEDFFGDSDTSFEAEVTDPDVDLVELSEQTNAEESSSDSGPVRHSTRPAGNVAVISSSEDSQSREPQRAEAATLASEVPFITGQGNGNEQSITRERNVTSEASCSGGSARKRSRESTTPTTHNTSTNDEDAMTCPICFEFWTTSGTHRLVSLKCGHLFGLACIEKWIKQPKARCPQCNFPAKKTDIRKIYARCLKVLDTCERDRAIKDLTKEQEKRRHAEVEAAAMRVKLTMMTRECELYKQELMESKGTIEQLRMSNKKMVGFPGTQREMSGSQAFSSKTANRTSFVLSKTLDLCKDGGCRVLAVSDMFQLMVASQPSTSTLFPSFGFKKISTMDFRHTEFVPVHQKCLKDLAFHSHDSLVLSTSLDKTVKITNVHSNSTVQSYNLDMDAWSCTWNKDDPSSFFVGLRNGSILQFDTRVTSTYMCQLPATGKGVPVVAMQYLEKPQAATYGMSGPISLQLSACTFFEQKSDKEFRVHPMPLEGKFASLCLEPKTGHMLVSCRPSTHHSKVSHLLCELAYSNVSQNPSVIDKCCSCNVIQRLEGGTSSAQLARSYLLLNPANDSSVFVCAGDESSNAVMIWDASSSQCVNKLHTNSPVLDICSFRSDSAFWMGALTDKQLKLYKWNDL